MTRGNESRSWKPRDVDDQHNAADLRYWSGRFGVSEQELREAIDTRRPIVKAPQQSSVARHT
jgi:Protein of unknown function (DUF3606)